MAKLKEIVIKDNMLFFKLLDMYETKDYSKEASELRNVTTEIEVRKRIKESFKLQLGMYSRSKHRIELEGSGLLIIIRRLNGEEEYRILKGLPEDNQSGTSIDPESQYRRVKTVRSQQVTETSFMDQDEEIPF